MAGMRAERLDHLGIVAGSARRSRSRRLHESRRQAHTAMLTLDDLLVRARLGGLALAIAGVAPGDALRADGYRAGCAEDLS